MRLADFANRKPAQLSGGQQQRVALARALVNYPSALLLDEPLGALDLKLRQAMQLELKRIQREVGITFVFVTHDQEEALTMSDRIAVMSEGRVEQIGAPEEIYHAPASVFVAGFIGDGEPAAGRSARERDGDAATVSVAGDRLCGAPRRPTTRAPATPARSWSGPSACTWCRRAADGRVGRAGTVADLVFQGPVVRFALVAPDGSELVAHVGPDDDLPLLRPGDQVWAAGSREAARLLRRSEPWCPITRSSRSNSTTATTRRAR